MKKAFPYIFLTCALAFPARMLAQKGEAYQMMVNGVKVIVQPGGNDIVVIETVIKGGVENYTAAQAGIESLAMSGLTECGTSNDDKNHFKNKLDKVSARMSGNAGMDYATFSMNCIKSDFETVWPLYTDAMLVPAFNDKEFNRIKQDAINNIKANESNPDFAIDKMSKQNAFAGKSYAKDPNGSLETVSKLTASATKTYWKSVFTRSRMVIVVVADLDKATIEEKIKQMLAKVPAGTPFIQKRASYSAPANTFKPQKRDNATNYVLGITGGPQAGTPDYNAFVLAMRVFDARHFLEIRSKHGLSYAPGAWISQGATTYSNIYVTTTEPDKYIAVARQLIDKVKSEGFTAEELKNIKTQYLTSEYTRQETNEAQAGSLAFNEVIYGNWKRAKTIKDDMKHVTLDEMNNVFRKYISHITWSYQGDPKKVTPALYTQKETPKMPEEKKAF